MALRRYNTRRSVAQTDETDPQAQDSTYEDPGVSPNEGRGASNPYSGFSPISRQRNPISYQGGNDINQMWTNNRDLNQGQGDAFEEEFGADSEQRRSLENQYGAAGWDAYQQLNQTPGYTADEQQGIMREGDMQGLLGADYGSNYLSGDEADAIRGNPYGAMSYLNPGGLTDTNYDNFQRTMGGVTNTEGKLNQNVSDTRSAMQAAVDPTKLGQSNDYRRYTADVLDTTGGRVWDAATNPELDMSSEYARQGGMSDAEVQQQATTAGQALGAGYRSAVQDLDRQAAASGNASPLAVAAMRAQYEDQNAVGQADAVANAQLQARGAQREAAQNVENTRAAANRYKSNAQIGAGMDLGNFAQGTLNTLESNRQAGERDISNRQMDVAQTAGQMGQQSGMYTGTQAQNALNANANRELQTGMYNQDAAVSAYGRGEQNASNRENTLAQNRQDVNFANQNAQYNRGYQVNSALSNRTAGVADARRQGQQQYRGYLTDTQQYQGKQGTQANQNRLTNRGQTQTGNNQAASGMGSWELGNKNSPGVLDKVNKAISIGQKLSGFGG